MHEPTTNTKASESGSYISRAIEDFYSVFLIFLFDNNLYIRILNIVDIAFIGNCKYACKKI